MSTQPRPSFDYLLAAIDVALESLPVSANEEPPRELRAEADDVVVTLLHLRGQLEHLQLLGRERDLRERVLSDV